MGSGPQTWSEKCTSWNAASYKYAEKAIAFLNHGAVKNVLSYCVNILSGMISHIFTSLLSGLQSSVVGGSFLWQPFLDVAINGLSSTTVTNPHCDTVVFKEGLYC